MLTYNASDCAYKITPTIFPDGTSQVWKLSDQLLDDMRHSDQIDITWRFESEAELMHLLQLVTLFREINYNALYKIIFPCLPYARQDKEVSNDQTFALDTFLGLLAIAFDQIEVFDPHSRELLDHYFDGKEGFNGVTVVEPIREIEFAIEDSGCDLLCFPDEGASNRYPFLDQYDRVYMDKVRDQLTGNITGIAIVSPSEKVVDGKVLIVDDLCDGGRTFREAAKVLYAKGAAQVSLYISHGIFSQGTKVLYDDGIRKIYTRTGLVKQGV